MSVSVSPRMARIQPSPTGAVLALATRLKAEGRDILSLGAGEPDFDTPDAIKQAAVRAIAEGATKYTPIDGTAELKAAIARKFARDNELSYAPSQIIVTAGAKQALFNLCLALLDEGDEAIVPAPYWVSYPDMVRVAGATPIILPAGLDEQFKITPHQLQQALTPRTRLLFLNSPSNPTGACYTRAELKALGSVIEQYPDVVVASDEIYEHIYWGTEPLASFAAACPALYERTVTCNGVSKAYAMTGWRIGYAAGPASLVKAMTTIQSQSTSNACSVSQRASLEALDGDQSPVAKMAAAYAARSAWFVPALNTVSGFECARVDGAFYAFPRVTAAIASLGLTDDIAFSELLLERAGLAVVPGSAFGAPGYLRLSFACSLADLEDAICRFQRVLSA